MKKRNIIAIFGLLVLVAAGGYLWLNANSLIKSAIVKYGSAATKADVGLTHVSLSFASGEGAIRGLSVGNPEGFGGGKALVLKDISIKVDTHSIAGNGPIIIEKIIVDSPQVNYDMTASGDSNLQALSRNAQAYAGSGSATQEAAADNAPSRKVIIRDLIIRNGRMSIASPLLHGRGVSADLSDIHLKNIGEDNGGATPADVARIVLSTIANNAAKIAVSSVAGIAGGLKDVPGGIINGAESGLGKLKSLMGR